MYYVPRSQTRSGSPCHSGSRSDVVKKGHITLQPNFSIHFDFRDDWNLEWKLSDPCYACHWFFSCPSYSHIAHYHSDVEKASPAIHPSNEQRNWGEKCWKILENLQPLLRPCRSHTAQFRRGLTDFTGWGQPEPLSCSFLRGFFSEFDLF